MEEPFSQRVRRLRLAKHLTQSELAKDAGYSSAGSIGDIEQGKQSESRNIDKLAKALGVTPDYLRTGRGDPISNISQVPMPTEREMAVLVKFRSLSDRDRVRVEDFLTGMRSSKRGPRASPAVPPGQYSRTKRRTG